MKIKRNVFHLLVKLMIALVTLVVLGTLVFLGLQISGRSRLTAKVGNARPNLEAVRGSGEPADNVQDTQDAADVPAVADAVPEDGWQEGDIRYRGKIYRYNEDVLTFLFLGIDRMSEVKEASNGVDGGQSDAIFLLVLNPHTQRMTVIGINRDTMTDIDVYSRNGNFLQTVKGQLCLQHGYGDGKQVSCERSMNAVSKLFYNLPIHGYCAVNMGAIPLINDAVGGVELTALETVAYKGGKFTEGQELHLQGMGAYYYLHNRDTGSFDSAGRRLERQKQYLLAYAATAREAMEKDITLPVKLYQTLSKYMVTDISVDEVSYLAMQISGYTLEDEDIISLQGETREGEKFEEFYVDEEFLYELILAVFYNEVES